MLVICFSDGRDLTWHVGDRQPLDQLITQLEEKYEGTLTEAESGIFLAQMLSKVYMLQADCDELQYIKTLFSNPSKKGPGRKDFTIPITGGRVMRWCGDIARTILMNL